MAHIYYLILVLYLFILFQQFKIWELRIELESIKEVYSEQISNLVVRVDQLEKIKGN